MLNISELAVKHHSIEATRRYFFTTVSLNSKIETKESYRLCNLVNESQIILKMVSPITPFALTCFYDKFQKKVLFAVNTGNHLTLKDPCLNAKEFIGLSLEYFNNTLNLPVNTINDEFSEDSINYKQFMKHYDKSLDNRLIAINNTWSSKVYSLFGYKIQKENDISIDFNQKVIESIFRKT